MIKESSLSLNHLGSSHNINYISNRTSILRIIKAINAKLFFHSSTYFTCVYYMDYIFSHNIEIDTINDIILICLSCLVVSAKFNEKDCNFPDNPQFISMLSIITKYKYAYSPYQLVEGELFVLRSLDYK